MIGIDAQIAEVETQARALEHFPGRMKPETIARKTAALRAASRSLVWLRDNASWIKPIVEQRRQHAEAMAELLDDPTVRAVREAFPDAEMRILDSSLDGAGDSAARSRPQAAEDFNSADGRLPAGESEAQGERAHDPLARHTGI